MQNANARTYHVFIASLNLSHGRISSQYHVDMTATESLQIRTDYKAFIMTLGAFHFVPCHYQVSLTKTCMDDKTQMYAYVHIYRDKKPQFTFIRHNPSVLCSEPKPHALLSGSMS